MGCCFSESGEENWGDIKDLSGITSLPHAAMARVAEFIVPGEVLCFGLTCRSALEATQMISGGIMPPASKAYFMTSVSLLSFAIDSLNISGVAWLHHVSARGMLHHAQALRARDPPVAWDHKTCEIAAHQFGVPIDALKCR